MMYDRIPTPIMVFTFKNLISIFNHNHVSMFDEDEWFAGVILEEMNKSALDLFKVKSNDEFLKHFYEFIPSSFFEDFLLNRKENHQSGHFSIQKICKDFNRKELILKFNYALFSDDIETSSILFTVEDLTQLLKLKENAEKLSLLPKANPNIVLLLDEQGEIEYTNPKGLEFAEKYQTTEYGSLLELMFGEDLKTMHEILSTTEKMEKTTKHLGQAYKVDVIVLKEYKKKMIIFTDITELSRISDERVIFYEGLEKSTQSVVITDESANIIYVNQSLVELYGYSKEELYGKNPHILNPGRSVYYENGFNEKHYNKLFIGLWKALKNPSEISWEGNVLNRKKNEELLHVRLNITKVKSSMSNKDFYLAFPIDITDSFKAYESVKYDDLLTIAAMAELRDNETGTHMYRVGTYAKLISRFLGQTKKYANEIEISAPLHDVGKVGIRDSILLAERKLTFEEFEIMKTHTTLGYEILSKREHMNMAALISKYHHEWYDGSGYPENLIGNKIPLEARIVALCDVYDALRSKRPYKEPWTHEQAKESILAASGTHFDPKIVDVFLALGAEFEEIFDTMR